MKSIYKDVAMAAALVLSGAAGFGYVEQNSGSREIVFESLESKSSDGASVFNRIKFFSLEGKDIWMMNQSHHGAHATEWDRLAIVVDKTRSPKVAHYYQLEPGPLIWSPDLERPAHQREFRVSCFICHSNGPRAIRPRQDSPDVTLGYRDRFAIVAWNIKIQSYKRIVEPPQQLESDFVLKTPFRGRGHFENEELKLPACATCHQESGPKARGPLTRQNGIAIQFMVEHQLMPPRGATLTKSERNQLSAFVDGN